MIKSFIFSSLLLCSGLLYGQYQVDITFTPPEKAMIEEFTGSRAMPIQANNVAGESVNVPSSNNQYQLLYFTTLDALHPEWRSRISLLESSSRWELHVFANDLKAELQNHHEPVANSVIPNSKMLSEAVFASELGHNRAFLVDPNGLIVKVFIAKEMSAATDLLALVESYANR